MTTATQTYELSVNDVITSVPNSVVDRLLESHFAGTILEGRPETDDEEASGGIVYDKENQQLLLIDLPYPHHRRADSATEIVAY